MNSRALLKRSNKLQMTDEPGVLFTVASERKRERKTGGGGGEFASYTKR